MCIRDSNVTILNKHELVPFLRDIVTIGNEMFQVRAAHASQEAHPCRVLVSTAAGLFGMVSERSTGDDIVEAFRLAMLVMRNLEQEYYFHWTLPVKAAFYAERNLVVDLRLLARLTPGAPLE